MGAVGGSGPQQQQQERGHQSGGPALRQLSGLLEEDEKLICHMDWKTAASGGDGADFAWAFVALETLAEWSAGDQLESQLSGALGAQLAAAEAPPAELEPRERLIFPSSSNATQLITRASNELRWSELSRAARSPGQLKPSGLLLCKPLHLAHSEACATLVAPLAPGECCNFRLYNAFSSHSTLDN